MSATNGSSKQLTVICEHWHRRHRRHRPSYFFVLTFKSHILKKILYDSTHFFHVWGVPILLTAPIQRQMFQETQLHHQSVPSMCEQCVRHPMLRVLATVTRSAKWPSDLDFKIEGRGFYECFMTFSSEILSDIGQICQEVGQMLPNAGWR